MHFYRWSLKLSSHCEFQEISQLWWEETIESGRFAGKEGGSFATILHCVTMATIGMWKVVVTDRVGHRIFRNGKVDSKPSPFSGLCHFYLPLTCEQV